MVDVEIGGCHFTLQFNHIYCVQGKSKVELVMQDSHPTLYCTKT